MKAINNVEFKFLIKKILIKDVNLQRLRIHMTFCRLKTKF